MEEEIRKWVKKKVEELKLKETYEPAVQEPEPVPEKPIELPPEVEQNKPTEIEQLQEVIETPAEPPQASETTQNEEISSPPESMKQTSIQPQDAVEEAKPKLAKPSFVSPRKITSLFKPPKEERRSTSRLSILTPRNILLIILNVALIVLIYWAYTIMIAPKPTSILS